MHLRRCAQCGHIGCCDTSPSQHASAHAATSGHPIIRSFEPGEDWFWDYQAEKYAYGPALAPPVHHPVDQPAPGPAGKVPDDWQQHLHCVMFGAGRRSGRAGLGGFQLSTTRPLRPAVHRCR
jgi:hypothetical protein